MIRILILCILPSLFLFSCKQINGNKNESGLFANKNQKFFSSIIPEFKIIEKYGKEIVNIEKIPQEIQGWYNAKYCSLKQEKDLGFKEIVFNESNPFFLYLNETSLVFFFAPDSGEETLLLSVKNKNTTIILALRIGRNEFKSISEISYKEPFMGEFDYIEFGEKKSLSDDNIISRVKFIKTDSPYDKRRATH